jgi:NADH dehydrogenase FAD-containing subunit
MSTFLRAHQVQIETDASVESVAGDRLLLGDGRAFRFDYAVNATGLRPPSLLNGSGLPVDREGALVVNGFLQSTGRHNVFGAGDCVALQDRQLDKVGVYAVRQAPILFGNLIAFLLGRPLTRFRPQRRYLLILNLGDGTGLATWGNWHWQGRWAFRLKDHLDRSFLARYRLA